MPPAKRTRRATSAAPVTPAISQLRSSAPTQQSSSPRRDLSASPRMTHSAWTSSSAAMQFMEEAFHQYDTTTPDGPETSAFSTSHWTKEDTTSKTIVSDRNQEQVRHPYPAIIRKRLSRHNMSQSAETELLALLPSLEAATLLVENYFTRVHWFMLVFHQSEFRERFRQLYDEIENFPQQPKFSLGFLGVFSAVCILSLRYMDSGQRTRIRECGIKPEDLQQQLLAALRMRLLDIFSRGSIEAVQVCVLLGSFHLYHGEPELAWPICGCGLRIAQALNLHRRRPKQDSRPVDLDNPSHRAEETRKRCWWAVYEIETFCSMLYGFPLSIHDEDCDIELLDPYPLRSGDASWDSIVWQRTGQATLLSYKNAMAQLSIIVKSALLELYGLHQGQTHPNGNSSPTERPHLRTLMSNVANLDKKLHRWYEGLPLQLRTTVTTNARHESRETSHFCLFQFQALALKIAFENARILIHRPLLSYRMVVPPNTTDPKALPDTESTTSYTYQSSIHVCRDAALQISEASSLPNFHGVTESYAVSFISMHLLTAAITLSILTSLIPLSPESHECKMGIRRLMEIQSRLKTRSIVAEQGLDILKKLMTLVLSKEMKQMLEFPPSSENIDEESTASPRAQDRPSPAVEPTQNEYCQLEVHNSHPANQDSANSNYMPVDNFGSGIDPNFDFYEDPTITQAVLDFEQVFHPTTGDSARVTEPLANSDYSMESLFDMQDQSWIWGSNHHH